jgi:hypothetical protein
MSKGFTAEAKTVGVKIEIKISLAGSAWCKQEMVVSRVRTPTKIQMEKKSSLTRIIQRITMMKEIGSINMKNYFVMYKKLKKKLESYFEQAIKAEQNLATFVEEAAFFKLFVNFCSKFEEFERAMG